MKRIALALCALVSFGSAAADELSVRELVAPIAFYPDVLVAQMLAGATHPDKLVRARTWLDDRRGEDAGELAQAVDGQSWEPDVKALTLVPAVLDAMNRNSAWTVALGEAYADAPARVLAEIQAMRRMALAAGELKSTSEQRVIAAGDTLLIEPVDPARVQLPGGQPFDIGSFERFGWGWHGWAVDWKHGALRYQDAPYAPYRA